MRILYVSHTSEISGGEHSLLGLLAQLPSSVEPLVATPPGPLQTAVAALGIPTAATLGTAGSLRLHPLHTPRALGELAAGALQVSRISRRFGADVVHANSIRAGIVLGLGRLAPAATVVHVRDCLPPGPVANATLRMIAATATTIVANSGYTARAVLAMAPRARIEVVHNSVDLDRWDPARLDRDEARRALGQPPERLLLGVVAQLSPWKGQDTAIEALRLLRDEGLDAHLLLIGSAKFLASATRFDNETYLAGLRARIADAGLQERVSLLGERADVPELVRALDILLLPSEEEPFGRALIEAMALSVPVLATNVGGPPEIVEDGREGYLLTPRDPRAWAAAIRRIAESADRGSEMGRAGRLRVERDFNAERHTETMLAVYERAIARAAA